MGPLVDARRVSFDLSASGTSKFPSLSAICMSDLRTPVPESWSQNRLESFPTTNVGGPAAVSAPGEIHSQVDVILSGYQDPESETASGQPVAFLKLVEPGCHLPHTEKTHHAKTPKEFQPIFHLCRQQSLILKRSHPVSPQVLFLAQVTEIKERCITVHPAEGNSPGDHLM